MIYAGVILIAPVVVSLYEPPEPTAPSWFLDAPNVQWMEEPSLHRKTFRSRVPAITEVK